MLKYLVKIGFKWMMLICTVGGVYGQYSTFETNLAGVYQGKTLFIQNPFDRASREFCIRKVLINEQEVEVNYRMSAIKLDFDGFDLFTPVQVKIIRKDSVCNPTVINPEAILFHTIFRFESVELSDSSLTWSVKGEVGMGMFEVEKLVNGVWRTSGTINAKNRYEGASYDFFPDMDEGANKYRIKYLFPSGARRKYLYSQEVDFDFYPDPVEFTPKSAKTKLYLSRAATYEIYDAGRNKVLEGQGIEVDLRSLRRGEYVIYFNGKDPGVFYRE